MTIKAKAGSISSGTLVSEELIDSFYCELKHLAGSTEGSHQETLKAASEWLHDAERTDDDEASDLVNELIDALNEFAPPYCFFGAHEGDGADFGFWPQWDAINELPMISDPSEADDMREDCVFMNDHGNVTVYQAQVRMVPVLEIV